MAQPVAATVTISSVGTTTGVMLDPTARVTNVFITAPSTTSDITLQVKLDIPNSGSTATERWINCSSVHVDYTMWPEGTTYTFISPISGLRLASSVFGSTWAVTMKILQEIIA